MALDALRRAETEMSSEDTEAYRVNFGAFKGGLTKQEVAKYYDQWAESGEYDNHLNPSRYSGPELCAQALARYFPGDTRTSARILDIAAGTGRLGAELHRLGFRNLDALDPSTGMLEKARARGIFVNIYNDFIGEDHQVPVQDGAYDGLAVSGGFGEGHIPCSALHEIIRIVKPGGMICIAIREEYLDYVSEYKSVLLPFMQNLETSGKWKIEAKDTISNYAFNKPGVVFQFRVI